MNRIRQAIPLPGNCKSVSTLPLSRSEHSFWRLRAFQVMLTFVLSQMGTTQQRRVLIVAGLFALVLTVWMLMHVSEPTHEGKTLTEWLACSDSSDLGEVSHAFAAIQAIGTNALPTIISLLGKKDSALMERCRRWLESVPFLGIHITSAEVWRGRARVALIFFDEHTLRANLPNLLELLHDPDAGVRLTGVEVLSQCMFNVEPAIGILENAQTDPDNTVRKAAQDAVRTYRSVKGTFTSIR